MDKGSLKHFFNLVQVDFFKAYLNRRLRAIVFFSLLTLVLIEGKPVASTFINCNCNWEH